MGLDADWLNTAPAVQWRAGLPPGLAAAGWVATQDASPDFARVLDKALDHIRHDLHLDDHSGPRRGR